MTENLTDKKQAKHIEAGSTLLLATAGGIREEIAKWERRQRLHPMGTSYAVSDDRRDEKKAADEFSCMIQTAMLRTIVATASELSQPGPYAVKATREKPIAVKDNHGNVQYIDDGMSCKNPFNTTAAAPVPGTQNTFKLAAPKKRSEMSFAEAASTPAATFYAQIGEQSAAPSSTSPLSASFDRQTRPPQTFADALNTDTPIVVPNLAPARINKEQKISVVPQLGPVLELNLN